MRIVLFILLALSMLSCGSKKVSRQHDTQTMAYNLSTDSITTNDSTFQILSHLLRERFSGNIKLIEWSKPDSTGKQHKVKEAELSFEYENQEESEEEINTITQETAIRVENQQVRENSSSRENIKQDSRMIPSKVWWFLLIGGVIAAIIAWLTRKRP